MIEPMREASGVPRCNLSRLAARLSTSSRQPRVCSADHQEGAHSQHAKRYMSHGVLRRGTTSNGERAKETPSRRAKAASTSERALAGLCGSELRPEPASVV